LPGGGVSCPAAGLGSAYKYLKYHKNTSGLPIALRSPDLEAGCVFTPAEHPGDE
jgi:hypothetical protein